MTRLTAAPPPPTQNGRGEYCYKIGRSASLICLLWGRDGTWAAVSLMSAGASPRLKGQFIAFHRQRIARQDAPGVTWSKAPQL